MLHSYPNLGKTVRIGCPDAQGPFNTAVNIAGVQVYMEVIKQPDLVHHLLEFSTDLYLAVIGHHKQLMGEPDDVGYSFSYQLDGGGRASDDSAVMMSSKMYAEFVQPYNARAYEATQGGMLHFCGKGDQFYDHMVNTPGVTGINFGNPEMQDFQSRYEVAAPQKICLLWDGELVPELDHITTGVVHKRIAKNWAQAQSWAKELP